MSVDELMALFFCEVADDLQDFYPTLGARIATDDPERLRAVLPKLSGKRLCSALFGLGATGAGCCTDVLPGYLAHSDPMVAATAIRALKHSHEAWRHIEPLLTHESEYIRAAALDCCGKQLGANAVNILLNGLNDPHFIVVESAIDALDDNNLVDPDVATELETFLNHAHPDVRQAARWALNLTAVYKIVSAAEWRAAEAAGVFHGAAIDLADGYIHFSNAAQVEETAAKHFAGTDDLLLVAVDAAKLGEALKWEASRGGALFPHLYAPLALDAVTRVDPLPLRDGRHDFTGLLQ